MINGIVSLDRPYERFQVQERTSRDKRKGRSDKENLINGLPECFFTHILGEVIVISGH